MRTQMASCSLCCVGHVRRGDSASSFASASWRRRDLCGAMGGVEPCFGPSSLHLPLRDLIFLLDTCLVNCSSLRMENVCSSETFVKFYRTKMCHSSEDNNSLLQFYLNVQWIFSSFRTDSANLVVRAGPVLRGILGTLRNVSFYVTYPDYDDEIMDYDIALVKVRRAKLEITLLSIYQRSTSISLWECAHSRHRNQGIQSHYIITNKEENKHEAEIATPPCLHQHL